MKVSIPSRTTIVAGPARSGAVGHVTARRHFEQTRADGGLWLWQKGQRKHHAAFTKIKTKRATPTARASPKSFGVDLASRWHMDEERGHAWRWRARPAEKDNLLNKGGHA